MRGINPLTGLTVSGSQQAAQRLKKAITTEVGTREKRRKVGGRVRKLFGTANGYNRMLLINRIHRLIDEPANDLKDIQNAEVLVTIHGAGFKVVINYEYNGKLESVEL